MKVNNPNYQVYLVTGRYQESEEMFYQKIQTAIENGVSIVQLREKKLSDKEFLIIAKKVKKICDAKNVNLIINDNILVAQKIKAAGVHIGQKDMNLTKARQILGKKAIIGVSVTNLEQAIKAQNLGADYIGVGAMFSTITKKDATVVSFCVLQQILNAVVIDVVVIGGINFDNINQFRGFNISGIASVSMILNYQKLSEVALATRQKVKLIKKIKEG